MYHSSVPLRPRNSAFALAARAVASVICSVILGAWFGMMAAVGMGMGFMAEFGMMFGAVAGLICSPALMYGLWHGPWLAGVICIAVPTTVAAFIGGLLTTSNGGPFLSMAIAVTVYVLAACVVGGIAQWKFQAATPGPCPRCRDDHAGGAAGVACPSCGAVRGAK